MITSAQKAIRAEIARRESELGALREALSALTGRTPGKAFDGSPGVIRKRRPKTAAEKKVLSQRLREAWARRKAAQKKPSKSKKSESAAA